MKIFIASLALFAPALLLAQTPQADTLDRMITLDETVISANKVTEQKRDVAQQIEAVTSRQIKIANPQTAGDLVAQTGQVIVQRSQLGGGSPVLRGFEASRILLEIDGVRMNNIIYRAGHLQNIITIDPSILERVEILFGPSSTVYGSDALGGVIHFQTKTPLLSETAGQLSVHANALLRYASAASEKTGHLDFNIGGGQLASWTSISFSDFDDLLQGKKLNATADSIWLRPFYMDRIQGVDSLIANDNIYRQAVSGYSQYDLMQKFLFRQNENVTHLLNLQFSNSTDVPRYDRLTDPDPSTGLRNAQWYYGPQLRTLAAYEFTAGLRTGFFSSYHAALNFQYIEESRHQRRAGRTGLQHRMEEVNVWGFDADVRRKTERNDFRLGLDGQLNSLQSTANVEDIETGVTSPLDTRYPDGDNRMNYLGLYGTDTYELTDHWVLNAGLRFQFVSLYSQWISDEFFSFPFEEAEQSHFTPSGSLGIIWKGKENLRISLLGSSGFRAPNVDDLAKVFESTPGNIVVPNPALQPEKTYNTDFSISKVFGNLVKLEGVGFYTLFRDAIVTDYYTFNGKDSILYDGELSAVLASQNKGKAFITGANGNIFFDFNDHFSLMSTLTYTYGRVVNDTGNSPLDHIPPLIGKTSIIYGWKGLRTELFAMYNGAKQLKDYSGSGEDNLVYATPDGMPAWWALNLRLQYRVNAHFTVQAACENLLDKNYRVFASGISSPGRNWIVALRGNF